jgi:hypothetical protein
MLRELFCWHDYEPISYYRSFWDRKVYPDMWEFRVIYRCRKCKKHKEHKVARAQDISEFLS